MLGNQNPYFQGDIEKFHREALKVLQKIGLAVENDTALQALTRAGLKVEGSRVFFEPQLVDEQLESNYKAVLGRMPAPDHSTEDKLVMGVGDLPQYYLNPYTGKTELMTVKGLIQATKFLESVKSDTVWSMVPGVPRDVPHQLQAVTEYYIGAEYCSNGGNIDTLYPEAAVPYLFEMASAMGRPFSGGGMFTISPLKIGGFEFNTIIKHIDFFDHFYISSLPTMGVGSPIYPDISWVVSIAEVVGAAIVLHLLSGGKPAMISAGMFPFDLHSLAVMGGSPEYVLMEYGRDVITKRYNPYATYTHTVTTMAKAPGLQAGVEKGYGAGFAVAMGCRNLAGAGLLSFDDIFSPEQAVVDMEMRDMLQRLIKRTAPPPETEWMGIIEEGLQGGYLNTEATLNHYREIYYFPKIFNRSTLHTFLSQGGEGSLEDRLRGIVIDKIENHSYRPPRDQIQTVRRIFRDAWRKLSQGHKNPFDGIID